MTFSPALQELRDLLCQLVDQRADIDALLKDAGVDTTKIDNDPKLFIYWTNVLAYAWKNKQVGAVIREAHKAFPKNDDLDDAESQWQAEQASDYVNRGIACANQGNLVKAMVDFGQAIALNPKDANAYYTRGIALGQLERWAEAMVDFGQAIALNPKDANAYYARGIVRGGQGDMAGAMVDFEQVIALNPKDANAYYNRGVVLTRLERWVEAMGDFEQAIAHSPKDANAYYGRGVVLAQLERWAEAMGDFEHAITLNPKHANAYNERGIALARLERWVEALVNYQQMVTLSPQNFLAWNGLAQAARRVGDEAGWQQAIKQARALLDEGNCYNTACFYSVAGEPATALIWLAKAIEQDPSQKEMAQQDPDLYWLHQEARFWELVGSR